jgi:hypothetical protein
MRMLFQVVMPTGRMFLGDAADVSFGPIERTELEGKTLLYCLANRRGVPAYTLIIGFMENPADRMEKGDKLYVDNFPDSDAEKQEEIASHLTHAFGVKGPFIFFGRVREGEVDNNEK